MDSDTPTTEGEALGRFLVSISAIKGWDFIGDSIRRRNGNAVLECRLTEETSPIYECPLTAVAHLKEETRPIYDNERAYWDLGQYDIAAQAIGVDTSTAHTIADAADTSADAADNQLTCRQSVRLWESVRLWRAILLKLTGLQD